MPYGLPFRSLLNRIPVGDRQGHSELGLELGFAEQAHARLDRLTRVTGHGVTAKTQVPGPVLAGGVLLVRQFRWPGPCLGVRHDIELDLLGDPRASGELREVHLVVERQAGLAVELGDRELLVRGTGLQQLPGLLRGHEVVDAQVGERSVVEGQGEPAQGLGADDVGCAHANCSPDSAVTCERSMASPGSRTASSENAATLSLASAN